MEENSNIGERLVRFFTFEPGEIPPRIDRFCDREGIGREELTALCAQGTLRAAAEEARRRYLDTLTAGALLKKYDPTFVKHLLELEMKRDTGMRQEKFEVEIRVVE